jgi:hypothetical protein
MSAVPPHLRPLVEDTPGSRLRLLAAWDGLSVDSQIIVLTALRGSYPGVIPENFAQKALASPNAYVRYLAAGRLAALESFADWIASDPEPLVRYAPLERSGADFRYEYEAETTGSWSNL